MDILEATTRVESYCSGLSKESFLLDTKTQDAVVRNIEVVGEAVGKLSPAILEANKSLPWQEMSAMRNKVIHEYFGINHDIVWVVACRELPSLRPVLERIDGHLEA